MEENIKKIRKNFIYLYKDTLKKDRAIILKAMGMSMFPFIRQGDQAWIRSYSENSIKTGDLVLFKKDGSVDEVPAVHRVIRKKIPQNIIITKGDSCFYADKPIRIDEVLGCVVRIKKKNRVINLYNPLGRFINIFFWFLSITYILPVTIKILFIILRKVKRIIKATPCQTQPQS